MADKESIEHSHQHDELTTGSGPLSATIQARPLSPDKADETKSWSASPNSITSHGIQNSTRDEDRSVASDFRRQQNTGDDSLLRVQVESSIKKTTFYVPISLMLQREVEMQEAATQTRINRERWSTSRLYSLWKSSKQKNDSEEITLRLTPEESMQEYSDLQWQPWLTACIRAYYNTGTIRIPEECLGSDILLALEYFGILTSSPDTFIFDSPHVLDRIKAWSSYFTHRNTIAEWVAMEYRSCGGANRIWITSPNAKEIDSAETLLQVNGVTATVLEGGLDKARASLRQYTAYCQIVHGLFFDNESQNRISKETPSKMRRDFCDHLQRLLNPIVTKMSFGIERVKITKASGRIATVLRSVLRMQNCSSDIGSVERKRLFESREGSDSASKGKQSNAARPELSSRNDLLEKDTFVNDVSEHVMFQPETTTIPKQELKNLMYEKNASEETELVRFSLGGPSAEQASFSPYREKADPGEVGTTEPKEEFLVPRRGEPATQAVVLKGHRELQSSHVEMSSEEQRHPTRSTPPPDDKRTSPENLYKQTIDERDNIQKQTISDREFLNQIDDEAPVGYINTIFGDLQSVTSALSDPCMDESTVGSLSSRFLVQSARKAAMRDVTRSIHSQPQETCMEHPQGNLKALQPPAPQTRRQMPEILDTSPSVVEDAYNKQKTTEEEKSPECGYWESFLAGVCEAVVPAPSSNNRSSSPVRIVTMEMAPVQEPNEEATHDSTMTGDIPMKRLGAKEKPVLGPKIPPLQEKMKEKESPDFFAVAEEAMKTASFEGKAAKKWLQSKMSNQGGQNALSDDSPVVGAAMSIGQNLSSQFDDLVRLALDPTAGSDNHQQNSEEQHRYPESLPLPSHSRSHRGAPANMRRARSNRSHVDSIPTDGMPMQRSSISKSRDDRQRYSESDVIITKNRRKLEMQPTKSSASAFTTAGSSRMLFDDEVKLPPRKPRRARVREQKMSIVRKKKHTTQSRPPVGLPQQDIASLPQASDTVDQKIGSVSKAKVKASAHVGHVIQSNKESSSTMEILPRSQDGSRKKGRTLFLRRKKV